MGKELSKHWYDKVFKAGGSEEVYFLKYSETPWYPVWKKIISRLEERGSSKVLDIGCGPGQFAHCLLDHLTSVDYVGIDFSKAAIDLAKELGLPAEFIISDAVTYDYSKLEYDAVVITEFLEHIHNDVFVLEQLLPGTLILATLPNMNSEGHVRFLPKDVDKAKRLVVSRYSKVCEIVSIEHFPYESNPENADFLIEMIKR